MDGGMRDVGHFWLGAFFMVFTTFGVYSFLALFMSWAWALAVMLALVLVFLVSRSVYHAQAD